MLKVLEWIIAGVLTLAVWLAAVLNVHSWKLSSFGTNVVLYFPVIAVLIFGLTSAAIIAYRVSTFRDCPDAAKELQQEIEEARADLKRKGLRL
ncbi:dolichol-phosphate mannosyltransferase subunit 3-like [Paramacrobiotus metropolitanus]|uniref:dolichol-phosphate mannosyltransferase subunit 3-like n=1 Tax=Paramacrobiotus metropolitanus TaxID=2943436 RepID=UPI002445F5EE|nr:dolichol-phosphate mannosyltransferase subunit 3-like [Paramacrobiotus metropolitanus]